MLMYVIVITPIADASFRMYCSVYWTRISSSYRRTRTLIIIAKKTRFEDDLTPASDLMCSLCRSFVEKMCL